MCAERSPRSAFDTIPQVTSCLCFQLVHVFTERVLSNGWCNGKKKSTCQWRRCWRCGFNPWCRKWSPTPVFFPAKSPGQRSLAGYRPWGCKESDRTEHTHTHQATAVLQILLDSEAAGGIRLRFCPQKSSSSLRRGGRKPTWVLCRVPL